MPDEPVASSFAADPVATTAVATPRSPPPARPAGGETGAGLTTVPIPPELAVVPVPTTPELAVVPVPMGPALPEGGVAQLPVDDIPGWFFATNGYFSLPMKGLENFFALVHDVTGAPW